MSGRCNFLKYWTMAQKTIWEPGSNPWWIKYSIKWKLRQMTLQDPMKDCLAKKRLLRQDLMCSLCNGMFMYTDYGGLTIVYTSSHITAYIMYYKHASEESVCQGIKLQSLHRWKILSSQAGLDYQRTALHLLPRVSRIGESGWTTGNW